MSLGCSSARAQPRSKANIAWFVLPWCHTPRWGGGAAWVLFYAGNWQPLRIEDKLWAAGPLGPWKLIKLGIRPLRQARGPSADQEGKQGTPVSSQEWVSTRSKASVLEAPDLGGKLCAPVGSHKGGGWGLHGSPG